MNKTIKKFLTVILSVCSGILYRMGGSGKYPRWLRFMCPLLTTILLILTKCPIGWLSWGMLFLSLGLSIGAISTYWDWLFKEDNLYMHGGMIGIAAFPLMWADVSLLFILLRAVILAVSMGLLNKYANKWQWKHSDIIEEVGRGVLIVLTTPILFI